MILNLFNTTLMVLTVSSANTYMGKALTGCAIGLVVGIIIMFLNKK